MLNLMTVILTYIAKQFDIEHQMSLNNESKNYKMTCASDAVQKLHQKYGNEEEMVRNEMEALEKNENGTISDEYYDLMNQLRSIQNEEDDAVKRVEEESNEFQTRIDTENDQLNSQLQAVNEDLQNFKQARQEDIEKEFGYMR